VTATTYSRDNFIDLLRGLAILLVLVYHALGIAFPTEHLHTRDTAIGCFCDLCMYGRSDILVFADHAIGCGTPSSVSMGYRLLAIGGAASKRAPNSPGVGAQEPALRISALPPGKISSVRCACKPPLVGCEKRVSSWRGCADRHRQRHRICKEVGVRGGFSRFCFRSCGEMA